VTKILNLSDEYIKSLSSYREKFAELVRKASILIQTMVLYDNALAGTLSGLGQVLSPETSWRFLQWPSS